MIRVKICGMTSRESIAVCTAAGADALGFVVEYPVDVPWNLSKQAAKELVAGVPPFVSSCMVTAGPPGKVLRLAEAVRPNVVQLHGEETLAETARIARELSPLGIRTVKALRTSPTGELQFEIADAAEATRALCQTGIHALLVDVSTPGRPGGSGKTVNRALYRRIREAADIPLILAGGLRADNLPQVLPAGYPPFAVDVLTGVESRPGVKNAGLVEALIRAVSDISRRRERP